MLEIIITQGIGEGPTELSAFDSALYKAGISNYNLIRLSSIIPQGSIIREDRYVTKSDEFGYKAYIVSAESIVSEKGNIACAGLGWIRRKDGAGLFVEHYGNSVKEVQRLINTSLEHMRLQRKEQYGDIKSKISEIECVEFPVCAVVCAVYKIEKW